MIHAPRLRVLKLRYWLKAHKTVTRRVSAHHYPHFEPTFVLVLNEMVLVLVLD